MVTIVGIGIIVLAIWATARRVDVRLTLFLAALALGLLAGLQEMFEGWLIGAAPLETFARAVGKPMSIVRTFLVTFSSENFVVPICSAMGFAHVLKQTTCDRHLVYLLVKPLRRIRPLLLPGSVVVGFLVNIPVISQASTAACIGSVLIPLLLAARIPPITCGAALLLGSSLGGELLNPGAPELGTISSVTDVPESEIVARVLPLLLVQLGVATLTFWILAWSADAKQVVEEAKEEDLDDFRLNYLKALVPLIPLLLLFLVGAPLRLVAIPEDWLVHGDAGSTRFSSRLVGAAMLVGVACAIVTQPKSAGDSARAFFEGAGYAFTHIISLIVTATCFGAGVKLIGLADVIERLITEAPNLLVPSAGLLSMSFAFLCGSGMAATQSLFAVFAAPARALGLPEVQVGAVVSIAAAAGRTLSPVAAVTLLCASMTGTNPLDLIKRVALPLLLGTLVVIVVAGRMVATAQP